MRKLKTAVIGVGYLGNYHAEKLKQLPQSELVAVCDVDIEKCSQVAQTYGVDAIIDYRSLIGMIDAVCIAAPTALHYEIALFFLTHGVHVLVEKPITRTTQEADELIKTAKKHGGVLQVGHLERFNKAIKAVEPSIVNPRFIESLRLAPFKLRGTGVNVVLDLMIHDIDIIQSIVKSDLKNIAANGASVLSSCIDIANARLEFNNGCVANVTASRVSLKIERKLRIFQSDSYIGMDLDKKKISIHRKGKQEMFPGIPEIIHEEKAFEQTDALRDQIESFLNCIIQHKKPIVSGEDGKRALAIAIQITDIVQHSNEPYPIHEWVEA